MLEFLKIADKEWAVRYSFLPQDKTSTFLKTSAKNLIARLVRNTGLSEDNIKMVRVADISIYYSISICFDDEADEAEFIMNVSSGIFNNV